MSYLITPPEEPTWRIDQADFLRNMQAHWDQATVEQVTNPARSFSHTWRIPFEGRALEGALPRDGKSVVVDGQLQDCAGFAVWARTQVPANEPLIFCDDAYNNDIELTADTSLAEILGLFGG